MRRLTLLACALLLLAGLLNPPATAQDLPLPGTGEEDEGSSGEGRYRENGDAGGFWNIMPPGADGVLNGAEAVQATATGELPGNYNNQTALYEELVYEGGLPVPGESGEPLLGITDGDIERFFKDGSFGEQAGITPIEVSDCGEDVVAFRDDAFGVPHIYGETREAAQCANGYATAADRMFLMDALRHLGRARLSEFLGASPGNQAMDREQLLVAPYTEEDLTAQVADLCESDDPEFQQVCADGTAYLEGVNHYIAAAQADPTLLPAEYPALQVLPEEFILEDIIAIASLVGGIFGKGGGAEAANSMFMASLIDQHGEDEARVIFEDLKAPDDRDGSLTTQLEFPYNLHDDIDQETTALLDPGSFVGTFDAGDAPAPTGVPGFPPVARATQLGVVDGPLGRSTCASRWACPTRSWPPPT